MLTLRTLCKGTRPSLPFLSPHPFSSHSGRDEGRQTCFSWGTHAGCLTVTAPSCTCLLLEALPCKMFAKRNACSCSSQHTGVLPTGNTNRKLPPATAVSGLCTLAPRSPWDLSHREQTSPRSHLCVGPKAVSAPRDLLLGCSSSEVTGSMWPLRHLAEVEGKNVGSPGAVI